MNVVPAIPRPRRTLRDNPTIPPQAWGPTTTGPTWGFSRLFTVHTPYYNHS